MARSLHGRRMKDTEFYQQVLGMSKPWRVADVKLELEARRVTVRVECEQPTLWVDPATGTRAHVHGWRERRWRHLDTCQFETLIEAKVPRVKYADGSVEEVTVPWAERYSRLSKLMEAFVIRVLQACPNIKEAAALLGLGREQVERVMRRGVERGLERRAAEPMRYLSMDEKSIARGQRYATVMVDIDPDRAARVWEVVQGRKQEDADRAWASLTIPGNRSRGGVAGSEAC